MSGNVKGITISFRGDTTQLDKALRTINDETRKIDRELKNVDKALKFNPTSVELWRQKQQLLTQKISETKEKLTLLKNEQARMDAAGIDKNSEEYRKLQREIIETESKVKTFEGQLRKVGNVNLKAASAQVKELGNKLTSAGEAMRGISRAAAAVTAAIGALTVKSGKWADDLNTMSKVYGISTGELQKYSAAAELVDVDVETIAKSHLKLEKTMYSAANGSEANAEAYKQLGVEITNTDGTLRSSDEVFNDVIAALGQMTNETERDAIAQKLMGKSAANLNPLIEDGGETYKQVAETLAKYDLEFIDQETLNNANAFNDSLDTIKTIGLVAFQELGTQLAATFAPVMEKVVDLVGRLANWFANLSPRTQALIAGISAVVAIMAPLLLGLGKVAFAISSIINLVGVIGPVIGGLMTGSLLPIIAIIGAVIAVGVLLYKNWDTIKAKALELWTNIITTFNGIKTAIITAWTNIKTAVSNAVDNIRSKVVGTFNAIKGTVTSIWNGIKSAITNPITTAVGIISGAINKIKSIINGANLQLPKFKLPHFRIYGGSLPWGIGGKGTPPSINVDWYASGGIFDSPSLIGIGERGAEAVVPLDILWKKLDNIADASGNGAVVVNVYGADNMSVNELAAAVEQRLIQMQKRRSLAWQ